MTSMDELEARVTALEAEVRVIREDAAAARVLAGGADRDVAAMGAKIDMHKALLESLRETQVEHGRRLDNLERRLHALEQRVSSLERVVEQGFEEMRRSFSMLAVGQAEILALLSRPDAPPPRG